MLIKPSWPAPERVKAFSTTRQGGVSQPPFDALNLGMHVGDDPVQVKQNREWLTQQLALPSDPIWLNQIHGIHALCLDHDVSERDADASFSFQAERVCIVMTADCLPVLLCDRKGSCVAAVHAGWRGLCNGIIEATLEKLALRSEDVLAWLGPAIGPTAFEVGEEVKDAFVQEYKEDSTAFSPQADGKWTANLYQLAEQRLRRTGVSAIYGGEYCTYNEPERFFSYRREGQTGRLASFIWIE